MSRGMPGFDKYQFRKILCALVPALKIAPSGINYIKLTGYFLAVMFLRVNNRPPKMWKVLTLALQSRPTYVGRSI